MLRRVAECWTDSISSEPAGRVTRSRRSSGWSNSAKIGLFRRYRFSIGPSFRGANCFKFWLIRVRKSARKNTSAVIKRTGRNRKNSSWCSKAQDQDKLLTRLPVDFLPVQARVPIANRFLLSLLCCDNFWAGQILVPTFVGQQEPRRSIPPSPGLSHCLLNDARLPTLLDHLIVLSN